MVIDIASVEGYKESNNYGYDCPIIDNGIYTEIPYTTGNRAAATGTATIEIPENIGYNGPCYLSAYNPWGRTIAVVSITLVPRA